MHLSLVSIDVSLLSVLVVKMFLSSFAWSCKSLLVVYLCRTFYSHSLERSPVNIQI